MKDPMSNLTGPKETLTEENASTTVEDNVNSPGTQKPIMTGHEHPNMGLKAPSGEMDRNILDVAKAREPKCVVPQPTFGKIGDS